MTAHNGDPSPSTIRVGINGAGRIGIQTYKALQQYFPFVQVVAFNDVNKNATPENIAMYMKSDSVQGPFNARVEYSDKNVIVNGHGIDVLSERNPANLNWSDRGVDIAVEATGAFRTAEGENGGYLDHIKAGAMYVAITVPVKDDKAKMVVLGVNYQNSLLENHKAISNASCTTNCLAPIVKVLHEKYGIIGGDMITIHGYTNDQQVVDGYHSDPRRRRAAAENIIPTSTGAAKAIGIIFPELKGKISENAMAYRVPIPDGSVIDLTLELEGSHIKPEHINQELIKASLLPLDKGGLQGILQISDQKDFVSKDVIGNPHSSVLDSLLTNEASGGRFKIVSWYDNEMGYSTRTADLVNLMAREVRKTKSAD